jgi:hypothetical protein
LNIARFHNVIRKVEFARRLADDAGVEMFRVPGGLIDLSGFFALAPVASAVWKAERVPSRRAGVNHEAAFFALVAGVNCSPQQWYPSVVTGHGGGSSVSGFSADERTWF